MYIIYVAYVTICAYIQYVLAILSTCTLYMWYEADGVTVHAEEQAALRVASLCWQMPFDGEEYSPPSPLIAIVIYIYMYIVRHRKRYHIDTR